MKSLIIGVDGGGTKTRISAVEANGRIVASAEGSSINYNNIGVEKAFSNFKHIIDGLDINRGFIRAISIGDPSQDDICVNPNTANFVRHIRNGLSLNSNTEIFIKSDVFMTLYGLTMGAPGVIVVSGTGSMGAAIDSKGNYYVSGGWGFPVSDTGSGYDIAVEALKYIFSSYDRYGYENIQITGGILGASALEYYGVEHPRELINCFHGEHSDRARVAEFSKVVYYCAKHGCKEAVHILEDAGTKLALCGKNLIERVKCNSDREPLVGMYGSVLTNNCFVRSSFINKLTELYPGINIVNVKMAPEYAAAVYARHIL